MVLDIPSKNKLKIKNLTRMWRERKRQIFVDVYIGPIEVTEGTKLNQT
jgi:hypothetical protein